MATSPSGITRVAIRGVELALVERGEGRTILWLHGEDGPDPEAPVLDLLAAHGRVAGTRPSRLRPLS